MDDRTKLEDHWAPPEGRGGLLGRILAGLEASGADTEALQIDDLAPIDEFHIRGREATVEVADYAEIPPGAKVLDVGSGLGGPSRLLATQYACEVTGIDLTAEYCEVASDLAQRTGLSSSVAYHQASATELPFDDDAFDVVWTQHVSMNVRDKARMFGEMARVARPGGCVVIYDPIAGSGAPLHYPVPWATSHELSHLIDENETRATFAACGLFVVRWRDVTQKSIAWFRANLDRAREQGRQALGFHLILGPRWATMGESMLRNLEEGRIQVVQAVLAP